MKNLIILIKTIVIYVPSIERSSFADEWDVSGISSEAAKMSSAHSPIFPSLYLRHSSFSNPSAALPTSKLILQPFFRFSYVTGSSLTSPGEPPMLPLLQ